MSNENLKLTCFAGAMLFLAGLVFLATESHGRIVESKLGIIAIVVIALLLAASAVFAKRSESEKRGLDMSDIEEELRKDPPSAKKAGKN
jgi:drug/metabolite transporter (DMT)-like permease